MLAPKIIRVNDIITRSPHLSKYFKRKYVKEVKERMIRYAGYKV